MLDMRSPGSEIHALGWTEKDRTSKNFEQVQQAWAPNRTHIITGSLNGRILLFDIRLTKVSGPVLAACASPKRKYKRENQN